MMGQFQRHSKSAPSANPYSCCSSCAFPDVLLASSPDFRLLAPPLTTQTSRPTAIIRRRLGRESFLRGFPRAGGEPAGTVSRAQMARRDLHLYRIYMRYLCLVHGAYVLYRDFLPQVRHPTDVYDTSHVNDGRRRLRRRL